MSTNTPTLADNTGTPLPIGAAVYTIDNKKLGMVKDVTETHFKVDVRFWKDYWLARDRIAFIDDDCVGMSWRREELELYRLNDPNRDTYARDIAGHDHAGDLQDGMRDMNYRGRFGI